MVQATGIALSPDLRYTGFDRTLAKALSGGGGGRPELAQAGGPDVERLDEALKVGREAMSARA